MTRILFLVQSLHQGGAERQLVTLLRGLDSNRFRSLIVTYYPGGEWEKSVAEIPGVEIRTLRLKNRFDIIGIVYRLTRLIGRFKPAILYGLLGDACLLVLLQKFFHHQCRVIWGLRSVYVDFSRYSTTSKWTYQISARLSAYVDQIIANSWSGREYHAARGYEPEKIVVVANGIDLDYFKASPAAGSELRNMLSIPSEGVVVGRVGRLDAMKDYPTFLKAARILLDKRPEIRFIIAGGGTLKIKEELKTLAASLRIQERLFWLGSRDDLPAVYSACNLTCSSSIGESFPNVVAESLACEVPCVATDVGDSRRVLGNGGLLVPAGDAGKMAAAWEKMLAMPARLLRERGAAGRRHVAEHFSEKRMVRETEKVFDRVLKESR